MTSTLLDDTEGRGSEERSARLDQLFFQARTVLIAGEINHKSAQKAVMHLIALAEESDDPINVLISSPGGHVESGDMVHDVIKFIRHACGPSARAGWPVPER